MTDEELKQLVERLAVAQEETFRRIKARQAETDRRMETERAKTDRFIKTIGKQVGDLGNKFGSFTEGLATPAMKKLLRRRFKLDVTADHWVAHKNGRSLELDMVGFSSQARDDAYIVEIKSRFREDEFQQMLHTLREAPKFFPPLRDKRLYGIVVAVDIPEGMRRRVLKAGLYLALPHDDTFKLVVPRGFKPKAYHEGMKGHRSK